MSLFNFFRTVFGKNQVAAVVQAPAVPLPHPQANAELASVVQIPPQPARTYKDMALALVQEATKYVGVREKGGPNRGTDVEMFQKAVDGKASGESWCLCFVQYCVKQVDARLGSSNLLFKTEHCLELWNKTSIFQRIKKPEPGCLVLWQHHDKKGRGTASGHIGIVTSVHGSGYINTIEGNTGSDDAVNREGDGVFAKRRKINPAGSMRVKGFLRCWAK